MTDSAPLRVLVVDDSLFIRRSLSRFVGEFGVVAEASNGLEALGRIVDFHPDVVLLDIEMPVMDGLTTLSEIMARHPLPVVVLSGTTRYGAGLTLSCLEMGAVDFIVKPSGAGEALATIRETLQKRLLAAAKTRVRPPSPRLTSQITEARSKPLLVAPLAAKRVVVIAASTGGPPALHEVLPRLSATLRAAVLVVQHMPPVFTGAMAQRLDGRCALSVREAADGDVLSERTVLVAPGGSHMRISKGRRIRLSDAPAVWGVRPAADPLFLDAAEMYGASVLGVVLTGMGCDGTQGLVAIKQYGGSTIAQDEETSLIFGMPRAAISAGVADKVMPLSSIPAEIERWCQ